jgi:hypothetical protein
LIATLEIEDCRLFVDKDKTQQFYLTQENIIDDCKCDDCKFYSEVFTKEPLEIFSTLSSLGVNLQKNLNKEPTGVWCIRDENDNFLHCDQVYQVLGYFSNCGKSQVRYEKQENGYKVSALFLEADTDTIDIRLSIDKT